MILIRKKTDEYLLLTGLKLGIDVNGAIEGDVDVDVEGEMEGL